MNESAAVVLSAKGLTKRFHEGVVDVTVLQGVDLDLPAGAPMDDPLFPLLVGGAA